MRSTCLYLLLLYPPLAALPAWLLATPPGGSGPRYPERLDLSFVRDEAGRKTPVRTRADWARRVGHAREAVEQVTGPLPPPTDEPLDVKVLGDTPLRHYTRRHLTFTVEKGDRAPAYLLIPHGDDGRPLARGDLIGVVCLPGSSTPGKDVPAGLTPDLDRDFAHELACRGHVCLVLDYPVRHTREYTTDPYTTGYVSATMKGVVVHRRGVDLLQSLPYVGREKIATVGHSLGGHNALFLGFFDPRVKVMVTSCGFNTFAKYMKGDLAGWSSKYYMPRIGTRYGNDPARVPWDFPELLASLSPRAVFVNAPVSDSNFEVSGVRDCVEAARPVYRDLFAAGQNLVAEYPDAGHTFPVRQRVQAYAFLEDQLTTPRAPRDLAPSRPVKPAAAWPLVGDGRDAVGKLNAGGRGVNWDAAGPGGKPRRAAGFDGLTTSLEVPADATLDTGTGDFSLLARFHVGPGADDGGDLLSRHDPRTRRGWNLAVRNNTGVTFSQPAVRQLQFGIDDDRAGAWVDRGRPGNAVLAFALATWSGHLYAGTCEPGPGQSGRVHRHAGGTTWLDCGAPDRSNAVTALAVHDGALYAGTGKYRLAGSALAESENPHRGGRVFRYEGGTKWTPCGELPGVEAVGGLVSYRGALHASSLYKPAGFFRHEGGTRWVALATPGGKRVEALGLFGGQLFATGYDEGHVYRFDGTAWTDLGRLGENTQTYALTGYQGHLHVSTWPGGQVFRRDGERWADLGRLGEEKEVMGLMVHNGRLLGGTLPGAHVFARQGEGWKKLATLDETPGVKYRRVFTFAEHDGEVFASALPSGRVWSWSAGVNLSWDHELAPGWHHVAAVKAGGRLLLYLDGLQVGRSVGFAPGSFDLTGPMPLRVGAGPGVPWRGRLCDVSFHRQALPADAVKLLARP